MRRLQRAFSILVLTAAACNGTPNVEPDRVDAGGGRADSTAERGPVTAERGPVTAERGSVAADSSRGTRDGAGCTCGVVQEGLESIYTLSWDCYCAVYPCGAKRDSYTLNCGNGCAVFLIREYAACGLVVAESKIQFDPVLRHVFNLADGRLVGEEQSYLDYGAGCPYDASLDWLMLLRAGTFPDASCAVTACQTLPGYEYLCDGGLPK